jgi:hypothetical protein
LYFFKILSLSYFLKTIYLNEDLKTKINQKFYKENKMKKFTVLAALILAFSMNAKAETIEISDDGDLTINVFADIIESFRVTISHADMDLSAAAPSAQGLLDLNGGLLGFDGLKSLVAGECRDDLDASPTYTGATTCAIENNGNASNSSLVFDVTFDVAVELSGPGSVDLAVVMGGGQTGTTFENMSILFDGTAASLPGLVDGAAHTLEFHGEAPFTGGPNYDDNIVVTVTKN